MKELQENRLNSPFSREIHELISGPAVVIGKEHSLKDAAILMRDNNTDILVITDGNQPIGVITEEDIVRKGIAESKSMDVSVMDALNSGIISIDHNHTIFEGLLTMSRLDIHHLIVRKGDTLIGTISENDWLHFETQHPIILLEEIDQTNSIQRLSELRSASYNLIQQVFENEGNAAALTQLVTLVNDRITKRVIEISLKEIEESAGPPPVPFAWIAMGSEGREEQTLNTDQDNGIIFANVPKEEFVKTQHWFLEFAEKVVKGLEICGFPLCPGNTMGTNPDLCGTLERWEKLFAKLIAESDPESLLRASIYFDFRCLYGNETLVNDLRKYLFEKIRKSGVFLRNLANNAMSAGRPPIHSLVWTMRSLLGLRPAPLDIKKQALLPLVYCIRILALAAGIQHTNTLERLNNLTERGIIPDDMGRALRSAYDFIMLVRLRQHFRQMHNGEQPGNILTFKFLDSLQIRFLIESLRTIDELLVFVYKKHLKIHSEQ